MPYPPTGTASLVMPVINQDDDGKIIGDIPGVNPAVVVLTMTVCFN